MLGLNRSGDYHNGFSVNLPIALGNLINTPVNFGNPVNTPVSFGNLVTLPKNFGNLIGTENAPTFSPAAGAYGPAQTVSIVLNTEGDQILYTTDGSTPTVNSEIYTGPLDVLHTTTIKAIEFNPELGISPVATATYTINGALATPSFSPVAGSYGPTQNVTITSANSTEIYYTTDGSTPTIPPTGTSTLYSGPVAITATATLKAIAAAAGYSNSAVGSAAYTINGAVGTPTFNPPAGTYNAIQSVTISATNSTAIYYTTDGSTPTIPPTGTTQTYSGPVSVGASETLNAIASAPGYNNSAVGTAAYTISLGPTYVQAQSNTVAASIAVGSTVVLVVCTGAGNNNTPVINDGTANVYNAIYNGGLYNNTLFVAENVPNAASSLTAMVTGGTPVQIAAAIYPLGTSPAGPYRTGNFATLAGGFQGGILAKVPVSWPNSYTVGFDVSLDGAFSSSTPTDGVLQQLLTYQNSYETATLVSSTEPMPTPGTVSQFLMPGGDFLSNYGIELTAPGQPFTHGMLFANGGAGSTISHPIAVGDWVIAFSCSSPSGTYTISDNGASGGNSYTQIVQENYNHGTLFYTHATKAATAVGVSAAGQGGQAFFVMTIPGATGIGNHGSAPNSTSVNVTTSKAGSYVIGAVSGGGSSYTVTNGNQIGAMASSGGGNSYYAVLLGQLAGAAATYTTSLSTGMAFPGAVAVEVTMV